MIVIVAKNIKNALRGKLKTWFIEIEPNIFVSSIKDGVADNVISYIWEMCDIDTSLLIIRSRSKPPFYTVESKSYSQDRFIDISGMKLIRKKLK